MEILQAKILEWIAVASSRDLSSPGSESASLMSPSLTGRLFTTSITWKALTEMKIRFNFFQNIKYRPHAQHCARVTEIQRKPTIPCSLKDYTLGRSLSRKRSNGSSSATVSPAPPYTDGETGHPGNQGEEGLLTSGPALFL